MYNGLPPWRSVSIRGRSHGAWERCVPSCHRRLGGIVRRPVHFLPGKVRLMKFSDESYNLRIKLDTKNCELSAAERRAIEQALNPLRKLVRDFPVADLYITVDYPARSGDYHVKTSLVLTGKTLFTGDRGRQHYPPFERCVRKLVHKVEAYKESLSNKPETSKQREGTHHDVLPSQEPDAAAFEEAAARGDYGAFHAATFVYEDAMRNRIGRWIERYPDVAAMLDRRFTIDDFIEEVFLNAFEQYGQRPASVRMGQWLEDLIDPSIRALQQDPDLEKENIEFARSSREVRPE